MVEVPPPAAASSASPPPIPLPIASASIDHAGIAAKAHPPASHSTPGTAGTLSNASNSSWVCPSNRVYPGLVNLSSSPKSGDAADTTGSCTDSSQPFTPFFFATLADTQLGAIDNNTSWEEEKVLCRMAVQKLNNLTPRPQFAIVCGDLVHHFPRMYPHTDPAIRDRQVADFKAIFSEVHPSIPLLCVCGNHDVGNAPTPSSLRTFQEDFGDDYFGFWVGGMKGLVINSNLYSDPSQAQDEYDKHHRWLHCELAAARALRAKHILLFGHHPLFLHRDDEENEQGYLGSSSFRTKAGEVMTIPNTYFHIPRARREKVLEAMHQFGCSHYFCGHWHQNGVSKSARYQVENVITSAVGLQIGKDKSGFRLVKVFEDAVVHKYFSFEDMPAQVFLDLDRKHAW